MERLCLVCGEKFILNPSWGIKYAEKTGRGKYCSRDCYHKWRKGRIFSPSTLIKKGDTGEKNPAWKGGRSIHTTGYAIVWAPNHPFRNSRNYVMEHRLVMEKVLGRYLKRNEVVHHIDGNKLNNDPSNLRLFANQAEHLRVGHGGK